MMRTILLILTLSLPFLTIAQESNLVLKHLSIVDVKDGSLKANVSVKISGNRIIEIGKNIKASAKDQVIEARGKFLIPGLWDMHVHLSMYGEEAFSLLVANGITGVRDMGGNLNQLDQWRKDIASNLRTGPRIKRAGPILDGPKKMSPLRATFTEIIIEAKDAGKKVDSLKNLGVDYLKVHSRLPRDVFFALAESAAKRGVPLVAHVPKDVTVTEASEAGARCIEHTESLLGNIIYDEDEERREKRTKEAIDSLLGVRGASVFALLAKNRTFYDPTLISLYRVNDTGYTKRLAKQLLPLITKLYQANIPLLTGSDFAYKAAGIRPGYDLHDELVLFVQAGMKPAEALRAATLNAAACLHLQDSIGSIEQGKIADLVLLDKNPLKNIRYTRTIRAVIVNGVFLERKMLETLNQKN